MSNNGERKLTRFVLWHPTFEGPELSLIEAEGPCEAAKIVSESLGGDDLLADFEYQTGHNGWSPGWRFGDESLVQVDTPEQLAGLANDVWIFVSGGFGLDPEKDARKIWEPLISVFGPLPQKKS